MTYIAAVGATHFPAANVATVECHKQVRSWRLLRALAELLIPTCNCSFVHDHDPDDDDDTNHSHRPSKSNPCNYKYNSNYNHPTFSSSSIITGTIFGNRHGKVKFCIQTAGATAAPILLLELAIPTKILAKEMQGGLLRIALECKKGGFDRPGGSLFSTPVWAMYCNGRRAGYAVKRRPSGEDMEVLRRIKGVVGGAGVIPGEEDDVMYMRGNFERVCGSRDAESFHLIDPDGCINQDLSIFFLRSR